MGSLLLSPGTWYTQVSVCALQESIFQSCLCSGSSVVGLMVTSSKSAYAIPNSATPRVPVPEGPLLSCTSTGDSQTQFCLSLCGVPGSWCTQDLFEPSKCLWQECRLILNENSPLLPSCWGFFFALEHGVLPHSCSSTMQPLLQRLPSCWGFSDLGHGLSPHGRSSEAQPKLLTLDIGYLLHGRSSAIQICAVILCK